MTHDEFLARCETIWQCGLVSEDRMRLLARWLDIVMRFEGGQVQYAIDLLHTEQDRLGGFYGSTTLANDQDGYALIHLAAILSHPCQTCAEDPEQWHTRPGFCPHKGIFAKNTDEMRAANTEHS